MSDSGVPSARAPLAGVPPSGEVALVLIVGGDSLALQVCDELREFNNEDVVVLWPSADESFVHRLQRCGARFESGKPSDEFALQRAGIARAESIILLSDDDHLNLETALKAREINANVRIVMRVFNRTLGQKIEGKLHNCSVISLSAQSAATYASAAVDRACFYGVQFPDFTGPLFGFAQRSVARAGVDGMSIEEAEDHLHLRVLAIDGELLSDRTTRLRGRSTITTFGLVRSEAGAAQHSGIVRSRAGPLVPRLARRISRTIARWDPLVRTATLAAVVIFTAASIYFSRTLAIDPLTAAYFVMSTMTTTGYGDIVPHSSEHAEQVASMITMAAGVVFTALFVAVLTSRFTQAQWTLQQGLRKIARRNHIVVCGAGNVGTRVIDFLSALDRQVVVIEAKPRSTIVDRSRDREFDLLTGDATAESTLGLCNLGEADALIALTESDTMNLEIALSAAEINARLPLVLRMQEQTFARSIALHFGLTRTFGTAGLSAPIFAGLSKSPGVRGFVTIVGHEFGVSELPAGTRVDEIEGRIPLVAWRDGAPVPIATDAQVRPGDRILTLYPVYLNRRHRVTHGTRRNETHAGMRIEHGLATPAPA